MVGLLLVPLVVVIFALRVAHGLARGLLWACWQVAACLITAALVFCVAWLVYRGFNQ